MSLASLLHNQPRIRLFLKIVAAFLLSRSYFWALSILNNKPFLDAMCQWDCGWYLGIIENGYDIAPHDHPRGDAANWAFFPLYPALAALISAVVNTHTVVSGILISNVFFILGMFVATHYLTRTRQRINEDFFIGLCMLGPYSFYFTTLYTEALFFFLCSIALLLWSQNRPLSSAAFAALMSMTRLVGVLWVPSLLWHQYRTHGRSFVVRILRTPQLLLAIALAPLGLFLYMLYLYIHVGDALAFSHIQVAWGREIGNPLKNLVDYIVYNDLPNLFADDPGQRMSKQYLAFWGLGGLLLTIWLFRSQRHLEAIFAVFALLLPLSTGVDSIPRYMVGIPMFAFAVHDLVVDKSIAWWLLIAGALFNTFLLLNWYEGSSFVI